MKRFSVNKISYSQPSKGYRIVLKEIGFGNYFSILIGNSEAQSVALALEGVQTPRPMTHDIIIDILDILLTNYKDRAKAYDIVVSKYKF